MQDVMPLTVSVYCDPMKQAVGVLMSCPFMETEIAPLCFGGMRIVFAMDTLFIPDSHVFCVTEKLSFVSDVTPFFLIPIIRYSVFSLEVYTQYDVCHQ